MALKREQYRFKDGQTRLSADELNKRVLDIDGRLDPLETKVVDYDSAIRAVQEAGLERINEVLVPAYEKVRGLEELGFLIAPIEADPEFAFAVGEQELVVGNGQNDEGYRDLFTPSQFLAFTREGESDSYAIARLISFNRETGELVVDVVAVGPDSVPTATDVWASGSAGSTVAQIDMLARALVARNDAITAKTDAQTARTGAEDALEDTGILRGQVATDRTEVQARRDEIRDIVAEPGPTPPSSPRLGQLWWDGTQTRVYDGVGFVPTVTASIGGLRMDEGVFGAEPSGEVIVGGGFQTIMVWLNGALLSPAAGDYTEDGSKFTIAGAVAGDEWSYWAYQANDSTDFYTKEESDARFFTDAEIAAVAVLFDRTQTLDDTSKAQARANIGALGGGLGANDNRLLRSDGTGGVTAQGSSATLNDDGVLSVSGLSIAGFAAKVIRNVSVFDVSTPFTTTSTNLQVTSGLVVGAVSNTSSLLVLCLAECETERPGTSGNHGMRAILFRYNGTAYVSAPSNQAEMLITGVPAGLSLNRATLTMAMVLAANHKRSDISAWSPIVEFASYYADCTAKVVRHKYICVEFEP